MSDQNQEFGITYENMSDNDTDQPNITIVLDTIDPESAVEEPVSEVEEPVSEVEEPVSEVEEPAVEEPVVDEPVVEEPVVEEPVVEESVVDEPVPEVEEPAVEEPVVEESAVEEPVVEEPIVEEPIVEEPIAEHNTKTIPKIVFIVPYRDREKEKEYFIERMNILLEDMDKSDYLILFTEQGNDGRPFNRGAIKNIGFMMVGYLFPNDYKDITLVFNDIDTLPRTKGLLNYETSRGIIKHFYGFTYTLGGIFSIKAGDFERLNGFPNYWSWGYEDNLLNKRAMMSNLAIDRNQFYNIHDPNIEHKQDSIYRNINSGEYSRYVRNIPEGVNSIYNISHHYNVVDGNISIAHINYFDTIYPEDPNKRSLFDLRNGTRPFSAGASIRRNAKMGLNMI
jgi:hypothetical protein